MPNSSHDAGKAPGGRRLQRRKAGIDQVGDDLRRDRVHRHRGEEEGREQRPEHMVAHRAVQRPAIVDEAGVGLLGDMRGAGGEQPPRHQQQRQQHEQRHGAEQLVGVAPADPVDQQLRDRQQHQNAGAGRRIQDRHRGRQPRPEPAAEQDRVRHVADEGDAETDAKADAQLELPEMLGVGGDQEGTAEQQQPERVDRARPGAVEQPPDQRRRQSSRKPGQRIDRDDLARGPSRNPPRSV